MLLRASEQKTPSLHQFSAIGPISRRVFVYIDSLLMPTSKHYRRSRRYRRCRRYQRVVVWRSSRIPGIPNKLVSFSHNVVRLFEKIDMGSPEQQIHADFHNYSMGEVSLSDNSPGDFTFRAHCVS